jgi:hypothetical protein
MSTQLLRMDLVRSPEPRMCFRCLQLGLPDSRIEPFEEHVEVVCGGEAMGEHVPITDAYACIDCFERLKDEAEGGD